MRIHPEAFAFSQALPALFLVWLFLSGLGSLVSHRFAILSLAILALYAATVLCSSTWLSLRHGWRCVVAAPVLYLTIHFGLATGLLAEVFRTFQRQLFSKSASIAPANLAVPAATNSSHAAGGYRLGQPQTIMTHRIALTSPHDSPRAAIVSCPQYKTNVVNAFSVDVEDYFHTEAMTSAVAREQWNLMPSRVQGNTQRLFEILGKHNVRATFFFLGWVAEHFPPLVREAVQLGHEVACHSYWHRPVYRLSPNEFREDTRRAKAAIEDAASVPVRGYRAPSFSLVEGTHWAFDVLAELGFTFDSSVHPIRHDLYGSPGAPRVPHRVGKGAILELPIATIRIRKNNFPVGGGGYLRLLPYAYMRWGLSRLNTLDQQPAVVYLHPWELDPNQPRLAVGPKARLRQYSGLASAERKLDLLLKNFHFATISDVFHKELNEPCAPEASDVTEVMHSRT
jgi:polysaccharide deacetylase family protein (PEP-CTERM system associated)